MDQAPVLDGLCFDLLPFCQDCRAAPEVDVGGCQITEAFVISVVVVMLNEGGDHRFKFALQGLCCTNPMRDSSRESSVVAGMYEQTHTPDLQDQELASLQ